MRRPWQVAVVIPARDEEALLPACLDSVETALAHLHRERPDVESRVVVVLDSCVDSTSAVVAARPGVTALAVSVGLVGAARAAGVAALGEWATSPRHTWIACTDADTLVPPHWLTEQLRLADSGLELVVGTAEPQPADLPAEVRDAWWARHTMADGHEHVHGANLGFTLEAYLAVGGFPPLPLHEDVALVSALRSAGRRWVATDATRVVTSGRHEARAPGGFAAYLEDLA